MKVVCNNCGYDWEYKGGLPWATCPSCLRKTKIADKRYFDAKERK